MSWNANGWNSDSSLMPSENQGPYDLGLTQNPWKTQQTQAGCGTSYQSWKNRNLSSSVWAADNQTHSQPGMGMYDCSDGNGQAYPQGQGQNYDNNLRRGPHMQGNTQHRYSDGSQYQPKNPRYQSPQHSPQQNTKQVQEFPNQETYSQTASRFSFVKRGARSENCPSQPQSRPVMSNGASQNRLMRPPSRPIANQSWNQPRQNWIPPAGNRVCGPRFQQGPRGVITSDWRNQGSCPQTESKPISSRQNQKLPSHKLGTGYGSTATGPLSKAAEKSLRVISCTAEGIHYWINSLGDSNPLIFEVFGMVNGLDYFENKIVFLIKGKAVSLQCNFYCMDQDVPAIVNGDSVRVIGRFDMKAGQFQCISVRQATDDEKSHAMKFVQGYSKSLQRFDMSKNEY